MKIVNFGPFFYSKSAIFNNHLRVEKWCFLEFLGAIKGCRVFLWASMARTDHKCREVAKVPVSSGKFPVNSGKCPILDFLIY